jgi:hypothetical protein
LVPPTARASEDERPPKPKAAWDAPLAPGTPELPHQLPPKVLPGVAPWDSVTAFTAPAYESDAQPPLQAWKAREVTAFTAPAYESDAQPPLQAWKAREVRASAYESDAWKRLCVQSWKAFEAERAAAADDDAATKIQAKLRQREAKQHVTDKKKEVETQQTEDAATKIQARVRQQKAKKHVEAEKKRRAAEEEFDARPRAAAEAADDPLDRSTGMLDSYLRGGIDVDEFVEELLRLTDGSVPHEAMVYAERGPSAMVSIGVYGRLWRLRHADDGVGTGGPLTSIHDAANEASSMMGFAEVRRRD